MLKSRKIIFAVILTILFILLMSVSASAASERENNNSYGSATNIAVNTAVSGSLSSNKDVDWYKFTVTEDGYFNISFDHELVDKGITYWEIRIYNSTGVNSIDGTNGYFNSKGNSNTVTNTYGVPAGTYYIKINPDYHSAVPYSLTVNFTAADNWETEKNNDKDSAETVVVNEAINGTLSTKGDVDWYKFTVTEDGYFNISFDHELVDKGTSYWEIRIYDSTGVNSIDGTNGYFNSKGNSNTVTNTYGIPAGTYYIKINPDYHSAVPYSLTVNFTVADDWETENNNDKDSAETVVVNEAINGTLSTKGDVDWYKFTVTEDGYFNISFDHELVDKSTTYWEIRIYDSTGINSTDGTNSYFNSKGNSNTVTNTYGVPAGTYYIKINPDYHSAVPYSLTVNFTAADNWETENNNEKESADEISIGDAICGSFSTKGDKDWYTITLSKSTEIILKMNHEKTDSSSKYWIIDLYDSSAVTKLATLDCYGNQETTSSESITLSAGTYYIRISADSYSGIDYSFGIFERHDCHGAFVTTKNPGCTTDGEQVKNCSVCGVLLETQVIPATGHSSDNWVIDIEATCNKEGSRHCDCSVCGESVSEAIPMLSHAFGEWEVISGNKLIPPIVKERKCSNCGQSEIDKDWSNIWITILAGLGVIVVIAVSIIIICTAITVSKSKVRAAKAAEIKAQSENKDQNKEDEKQ